jgi:hypothetical protein
MRAAVVVALVVALVAALPCLPREAAAQASPPMSCADLTETALLGQTIDAAAPRIPPPQLSAGVDRTSRAGAAAGFGVLVMLQRPATLTPQRWNELRFLGAARSTDRIIDRAAAPDYARAAVRADLISRTDTEAVLRVHTPERTRRAVYAESWQLVVLACQADYAVVGFAAVPVLLHDWGLAIVATVLFGIAVWAGLAYAASRRHAKRLHDAWQRAHPRAAPAIEAMSLREALLPANRARFGWKALRATDPVFISQDGLGDGSLGRLQLLVFSVVVACLLLYVWLRTGVLVGFSDDILALLGITGAGTALSRIAGLKRAVSAETQTVLMRIGVLDVNKNMPSWVGVVSSDGEVDVTRVQALLFSVVVLLALVVGGASDLTQFNLPDQLQYLLMLSQGVYVAGKLVPSEACRRLDTEVKELISTADEARRNAEGAAERFAAAKATTRRTLTEVYGSRFNETAYDGAQPRDIWASPEAQP